MKEIAMTRCRKFFALLLICSFFILAQSYSAQAQSKIAVVDLQELLSQSDAAKSLQTQFEEKRQEFQEDFSTKERDLLDQRQALAEQQKTLSEDEFIVKREEFETSFREVQDKVQEKKRLLDDAIAKSVNLLRGEILKIVSNIADENDYDIVLPKQNVLMLDKNNNITPQVMERLNASLKTLDLKLAEK